MIELPLAPSPFPTVNYCDGSSNGCLDVRITAICDSSCSFCIAADDMKHGRTFDLDSMVASAKLSQATSMSIIGGEPLLFLDRLNSFIDRIREEYPQVGDFYVTTALPWPVKRNREKFDELMGKITVLNVSLQHFDDDVNNLILRTHKRFSRLGLLADILKTEGYPSKIRVHLNLVRGGIDNVESLNACLLKLREMGILEVKINELMNAPEEYVSFEEISGETMDSPYSGGCSTYVDFFPGIKTLVKRSCFIVEPSRSASKRDLLKVLHKEESGELERNAKVARVLYEDGALANSWQGEAV